MKNKRYQVTLNNRWYELIHKLETQSQGSPQVMWSYHVSPPFPSRWPLEPKASLYYYAYGVGHDISGQLSDGVYISAPWARLEKRLPDLERTRVKFLSKEIKSLGVQGIRPLLPAEIAPGEADPIEKYLLNVTNLNDLNHEYIPKVRHYFQFWFNNNGVLSQVIRRYHRPFYFWLSGASSKQL